MSAGEDKILGDTVGENNDRRGADTSQGSSPIAASRATPKVSTALLLYSLIRRAASTPKMGALEVSMKARSSRATRADSASPRFRSVMSCRRGGLRARWGC